MGLPPPEGPPLHIPTEDIIIHSFSEDTALCLVAQIPSITGRKMFSS